MQEKEFPKYEVPQIDSETGVSNDYSNEITTIRIDFLMGNKNAIIDRLNNDPVKKYQERFPENLFGNVITEKNKDAVKRLNHLADRMNRLGKDEYFRPGEFVAIYNEMIELIYGPKESYLIKSEEFGKWKK